MNSTKAKQKTINEIRKQIPKTVKRMDKEILFQIKERNFRASFKKQQQHTNNIDLVYKYYKLQGFFIVHGADMFILRWD